MLLYGWINVSISIFCKMGSCSDILLYLCEYSALNHSYYHTCVHIVKFTMFMGSIKLTSLEVQQFLTVVEYIDP